MAETSFKWARLGVSALGVSGLSLSALYVFAVAISFDPRGAEISRIMVGSHAGEFGWALPLAVVPYATLVIYLFLRTRLAHWMLAQGAPEAALNYVDGKMSPSLVRSKIEVTSHRTAAVAANMRVGRYDAANEIAKRLPVESSRNPIVIEGLYWRALAALRRDDLVDAHRVLDGVKVRRKAGIGDLLALRAILCARENDREGWESARDKARWARGTRERLGWCWAFGVANFGVVGEAEHALRELEQIEQTLNEEAPGRAPEVAIVKAKLGKLIGSEPKVSDAIELAQNLRHPDGRSTWLLASENS